MLEHDNLVMFSGGKNSILAVCAAVKEPGSVAHLLVLNNGCLSGLHNVMYTAERLANRFGEKKVKLEGVYNTTPIIQRLYSDDKLVDANEAVGNFLLQKEHNTSTCFYCHSAMWIATVAYAIAKGYPHIYSGYRQDAQSYRDHLTSLAQRYQVETFYPVWSLGASDAPWEPQRNQLLLEQRIYPEVFAPVCSSCSQESCIPPGLNKSFDFCFQHNILPKALKMIPVLRETLRDSTLVPQIKNQNSYTVPSVEVGLY